MRNKKCKREFDGSNGLAIGTSLGLTFGLLFHNIFICLVLGMCIGLLCDEHRKKKS